MKKKKITFHVLITGGTIDSHYDASKDTCVPNETSIIPSYFKSLRLYSHIEFATICMKDSRELTMNDLDKILQTIEKSPCDKILITHGTYTMPDTARFLKANLKRHDQVILLTASMIPIQGFSPSDGPFNLGYALAKLEHLPRGVYVAMNGKVFQPEEVTKIIHEGRFSSVFRNK